MLPLETSLAYLTDQGVLAGVGVGEQKCETSLSLRGPRRPTPIKSRRHR